jgi:hypothetical protein
MYGKKRNYATATLPHSLHRFSRRTSPFRVLLKKLGNPLEDPVSRNSFGQPTTQGTQGCGSLGVPEVGMALDGPMGNAPTFSLS